MPKTQYIEPQHVLDRFADLAERAIVHRQWWQNAILAVMAGALICMGALFSILLAAGIETVGISYLMLGFGFSAGFFFVLLSGSVLFTEVNVLVPADVLKMPTKRFCFGLARFWVIAAIGNLAGAFIVGQLVNWAAPVHSEALAELQHLVDKKMSFHDEGGAAAWWRAVVSGILANWLVGMAAFFAVMGRTIIGKYIPVLLVVTLFVAANFQHSPANAGYFSLAIPAGVGPEWATALLWNLAPAALGNILGAILLVALPFHLAFGHLKEKKQS